MSDDFSPPNRVVRRLPPVDCTTPLPPDCERLLDAIDWYSDPVEGTTVDPRLWGRDDWEDGDGTGLGRLLAWLTLIAVVAMVLVVVWWLARN